MIIDIYEKNNNLFKENVYYSIIEKLIKIS